MVTKNVTIGDKQYDHKSQLLCLEVLKPLTIDPKLITYSHKDYGHKLYFFLTESKL